MADQELSMALNSVFSPSRFFTEDNEELTLEALKSSVLESADNLITIDIGGSSIVFPLPVNLTGSNNNKYKLDKDNGNVLILRGRFLNDFNRVIEESTEVSAELNTKQSIKYLKGLLYLAEKNNYYVSLANRLHQEASQDAVDIIQSKKIEFESARRTAIDVTGLFTTALLLVFFEAGIAEFLIVELLNTFKSHLLLRSIAKTISKDLKETQKSIEEIQSFNRALSRDLNDRQNILLNNGLKTPVGGSKVNENFREDLKKEIDRLIKFPTRDKELKELKDKEKKFKETITALSTDKWRQTIGKNTALDPKKNPLGDLNIDSKALEFGLSDSIIKTLRGDEESSLAATLPLEVNIKTIFQNIFEEQLILSNQTLLLIKVILVFVENRFEQPANFQEIIDELPLPNVLLQSIERYEEYFSEGFQYSSAKDALTLDYELVIWSLYYGKKIEGVEIIDISLLLPGTPKGENTIEPTSVKADDKDTDFNFPFDRFEKDYFMQRFRFKDTKSLGFKFMEISNQFKSVSTKINQTLNKSEISDFRINVLLKEIPNDKS